MKRLFVWVLVSAGLHGGIFWGWSTSFQPATLSLQIGQEAVSLQMVNMRAPSLNPESESLKKAENQVSQDKTPALKKAQKTEPSFRNKDTLPAASKPVVNTQSAQPVTAGKVEPANPLVSIEPVQIAVPEPQEKIIETPEILSDQQPVASTARVSTDLSEGVILQATLMSSQKPNYPQAAIVRNQQGKVTVRLWVDQFGEAQSAELINSSGYRLLDRSVLRFVERERFVPASQNGLPVASAQEFSFRFVLQ